ncbi:MAG: UDP-N-acetylmuramoyl-L-alanyl-D-glutamate--2,6-diaminopimelate ligase [Proteobacteria bacterium]|nr:UDP-N-acetylmuramoyl-L-alanyl-D-glutamate--2,6-diaminopimelate ligase [Pseudomonadota bacterium]
MNHIEQGLKNMGAVWQGDLPNAANVVDDTREMTAGDYFVLRQGAAPITSEQAGRFIKQAEDARAAAVIADPDIAIQTALPLVRLREPHRRLGEIARIFYGEPSHEMKVIAVTGTNGKTTTTYLIESLAQAMGIKVGVLGTISHRYPGYEEPSANTTPGTLKLYRLMRGMVSAGCEIVAMEVSSHGIMQGRIDGVAFDAAIWNNLGTDHLDFHITRENYALAKQRLFDHYLAESYKTGKRPTAIGNADDDEVMAHIMAANPQNWGGRVMSFSISGKEASLEMRDIHWENGAWIMNVRHDGQTTHAMLPLVGQYNAANAAGAVSALLALGYRDVANALSKIRQIPGRMECICPKPAVIVDFAHTPEALDNALRAARTCVPEGGKLFAVFGAGGDRDPSKRPMMGKTAAELADRVFVTSDNPRTENPESIIGQIVNGIPKDCKFTANPDRAQAIHQAVAEASDRDVILIAGKGHEDYQIIGTQKIHFDDRETARNALQSLGIQCSDVH